MKQKHIPKELLIGESLWRVRFVRHIPDNSKDKLTLGLCCPDEKTIYIRQGQSFEERLDTVIHEIIHAAEYEFQFELEHRHVHKLGEVLAKIYIQNF